MVVVLVGQEDMLLRHVNFVDLLVQLRIVVPAHLRVMDY